MSSTMTEMNIGEDDDQGTEPSILRWLCDKEESFFDTTDER